MKRICTISLMTMLVASCGPLNDMNSSTTEMNGNVATMNNQMGSVKTATTHMATQMDNAVDGVNKIISQLPLQTSQQNNQSDIQLLNLRYTIALRIALEKMTGIDMDVLKDGVDEKLLSAVKSPVDISSQTSAQMDTIAAYLGEASRVKEMVQNLKGNLEISPTLSQVIEKTKVTVNEPQPSNVSEDEAVGRLKQAKAINDSLDLLRK